MPQPSQPQCLTVSELIAELQRVAARHANASVVFVDHEVGDEVDVTSVRVDTAFPDSPTVVLRHDDDEEDA